jgi:hypothetical protein
MMVLRNINRYYDMFISFLPLIIFLSGWTLLTAIGATFVLTKEGYLSLEAFLGWTPTEYIGEALGGGEYMILLLSPYFVVPLFAVVSYWGVGKLLSQHSIIIKFSRRANFAILFVSTIFCIYKLFINDYIVPQLLIKNLTYIESIQLRSESISNLGFLYYGIIYAIIPMCATMFFASWIRERLFIDIFGLTLSFLIFFYLAFTTYMKAPFLMFFIMLGMVVFVIRRGWIYLPALGAAAIGTFLTLQVLIGGFAVPETVTLIVSDTSKEDSIADSKKLLEPHEAEERSPEPVRTQDTVTPVQSPVMPGATAHQSVPSTMAQDVAPNTSIPTEQIFVPETQEPSSSVATSRVYDQYKAAITNTLQSVVFRMGSSFPFYVGIFSDPTKRCGIETNSLPLLPKPQCDLPTKVFAAMYPHIDYVIGFAPAAAHVSAFGEIGLGYALFVLMVVGISIGVMSRLARAGSGPVFAALGVAACIYAYYLTQVPLLGALSYSHGLIVFLIPIVIVSVDSFLFKKGNN